eukprot:13476405-Heterocapsa_arctica.AAC.1
MRIAGELARSSDNKKGNASDDKDKKSQDEDKYNEKRKHMVQEMLRKEKVKTEELATALLK